MTALQAPESDQLALGARGRLEQFRRDVPGAVGQLAAFVVDNPGQVALLCAGTFVVAAAARNIVRPKTVVELLALQAVMTAAAPYVAGEIVKRGWLKFRVRDPAGQPCPVTLEGASLWAIRSRSSLPASSVSGSSRRCS